MGQQVQFVLGMIKNWYMLQDCMVKNLHMNKQTNEVNYTFLAQVIGEFLEHYKECIDIAKRNGLKSFYAAY